MGHLRRRSVDVGGLALALGHEGRGHGWGGWEETEKGETRYAEVLIDVCAATDNIVNLEPLQLSPFIIIEDDARLRLIQSLGSWHFEPHKLPEEEVLACAYILFEAVYRIEGMQEEIGVPLAQLATFLQHLRHLYRRGNTYHNFQHALDVFQATYFFLCSAGIVPHVSILLASDIRLWKPDKATGASKKMLLSCLSNADIFALYIAAIGHDVGHPGLTNAFLKNAKTPLAEMYDDKSILEQMHYSLLLSLMRHHGLSVLLDRPEFGPLFRKVLLLIVLATDMSVHSDFMATFQQLVQGAPFDEFKRKILVCQALIKCADISNPSRPHTVSKHWAAALESEWTSQLLLEQHLHLPQSVKPSTDRLSEARTQVFFTKTFALPLFQLTASGIPQLAPFAQECQDNLVKWEQRCSILVTNSNLPSSNNDSICPIQLPEDFLTAFPPTLPRSFLAEYENATTTFDVSSAFFSGSSVSGHSSRPSSSGSSAYSHYETCTSSSPSPPQSPTHPNSTVHMSLPRLDVMKTSSTPSNGRTPSIISSSTFSINTQDATAAIRAAYNASVRKKKSFHRSSWNPSPTEFAETKRPTIAHSPLSPLHSASPLSPPSASTSSTLSAPSPLTPASLSEPPRKTDLSVCGPPLPSAGILS